jgi:hypothetical protein
VTREAAERLVRRRRFVAAPAEAPVPAPAPGDAHRVEDADPAGPLMSPRAAILGACMGAAALLGLVAAAGFSGQEPTLSAAKAQEVSALREQIDIAQADAAALPQAADADRGLVTAQASAEQVAQLQNEYRRLTPSVAAASGRLDPAAAEPSRRNLTPYFSPGAAQRATGPWYLLASDKDVPAGNGIPMSFDSGFEWVAQRPYSIEVDGTIRVTWLAMETRPAAGRPAAVLAWARADFDITRKTFSDVTDGTTTGGESLRQEVEGQ